MLSQGLHGVSFVFESCVGPWTEGEMMKMISEYKMNKMWFY